MPGKVTRSSSGSKKTRLPKNNHAHGTGGCKKVLDRKYGRVYLAVVDNSKKKKRRNPFMSKSNVTSFRDHVRNRRGEIRDRDAAAAVVLPGSKEVIGGGWVRNETVRYNGSDIGIIQTRYYNGIETVLTIGPNSTRPGRLVEWLVNELTKNEWAGRTFRSPHTIRRAG
jgi:hypothetical protein